MTIALLISAYFFHEKTFFVFIVLGILILYLVTIAFGSGLIQLNYFVKSINKSKNKGISITFDDSPDANLTPKILDILANENIKASFFVIGHKIEQQTELIQRIHNEGHVIGNHSFSHTRQLTTSSTQKLIEDISNCSQAIEKIIQKKPLFFRPPFGVTSPRYKRAIKALNMKSIGWSIRSLDTKTTDTKILYKKVVNKITDGSILLFHDTQEVTLKVLPELIQHCKNNGIDIVPLPEFINENCYE